MGSPKSSAVVCASQVVPESAAWQKPLVGAELQAKRLQILETHSTVLASTSESFRPRRKFRGSGEKCLNMWDNQVRLSVHPHGLWWFSTEASSFYGHGEQNSDWPGASLCSDQGSDMMSLVHVTLYYEPLQLNLWEFWDVLHGCTRCLMGTVTQKDLKPLVHFSLTCINLPHGPK